MMGRCREEKSLYRFFLDKLAIFQAEQYTL